MNQIQVACGNRVAPVNHLAHEPEQIPAVLLGMLGIDRRFAGMHLGSSLLRDAILRSQRISAELGARALIVDPFDDCAKSFYLKYGFKPFEGLDRMYLPLV